MKRFAFVTRHAPTPEQAAIAAQAGIELVPVGDRDGFSISPEEFTGFSGVVVVHAGAALRCFSSGITVGVFDNVNRAPVGQKPDFRATRLVIWAHRDGAVDPGEFMPVNQIEVVL